MKPLVEGLERANPAIEFRRLNVDGTDAAASQLANKVGVQYVPTFVLVTKDGVSSDLLVGEQTVQTLQAGLDRLK